MLSLNIIRWLLGYVRFSVLGGSPERFYNYCARAGISFWNISSRRNSGACVAVGSYRSLRRLARKAGCRLRVRERHGFPFLMRRMRTHRGILCGTPVFLLILMVLSLHVWCIEIAGNPTIDTGTVLSALSENGLYPGAALSSVDTKAIEQKMMLMFPKIRWMRINTKGCTMQVSIQEKEEQPEIEERSGVYNVKAATTGQIVAMRIFAGTALVKPGEAVTAGQLLVSGVVEDEMGGTTFVHASAEMIAETEHSYEIRVPMQQHEKEYTGTEVTRRSINLFGANFPLTFIGKPKGDYEVSGVRTDIKLFGTLLPVSFYEENWAGVRTVPITLTRRQAEDQAKEELANYEKALPEGTKVLSTAAEGRDENGTFIYSVTLKCEENIAKESEILIKS